MGHLCFFSAFSTPSLAPKFKCAQGQEYSWSNNSQPWPARVRTRFLEGGKLHNENKEEWNIRESVQVPWCWSHSQAGIGLSVVCAS